MAVRAFASNSPEAITLVPEYEKLNSVACAVTDPMAATTAASKKARITPAPVPSVDADVAGRCKCRADRQDLHAGRASRPGSGSCGSAGSTNGAPPGHLRPAKRDGQPASRRRAGPAFRLAIRQRWATPTRAAEPRPCRHSTAERARRQHRRHVARRYARTNWRKWSDASDYGLSNQEACDDSRACSCLGF